MPAAAPPSASLPVAPVRKPPAIELAALPPLPNPPSVLEPIPLMAAAPPARQPSTKPVFHDLFHSDSRGAVSAVVAELWTAGQGARMAGHGVASRGTSPDAAESSRPVDVFGLTQHRRART
jgi:hypothetical protein